MKIKNLSPNPDNPRVITDAKLKLLKKALEEFGDLGGFVYNRRTKLLVGGHQRSKLLFDSEIEIEKTYKKPTSTGTVAEGFVLFNGERFKYREVYWDEQKEKAANIAANKGAGSWSTEKLTRWMDDLSGDFDFDLDLTMFDETERSKFNKGDKPEKDKENGRVSSSAVKQFQLMFTEESAQEFLSLIEHFQSMMNSESVSDTVLEVLRLAKQAKARDSLGTAKKSGAKHGK